MKSTFPTNGGDEPVVYLSGPIQHLPDAGHGWRNFVIEQFQDEPVTFINPLDSHDPIAEDFTVYDPRFEDEPPGHTLTVTDIVEDDLANIDQSDGILVYWDDVQMAGTPMEMRYSWYRHLPIVTCYEHDLADLSPWVLYHSDEICHTLTNATDCLIQNI